MKESLPQSAQSNVEDASIHTIDAIKTMQAKQEELLSEVMPHSESFSQLVSQLTNLASQPKHEEAVKIQIDKISSLLDTFKKNALNQLRTYQEELEVKSACLDALLDNADSCIIQLDEHARIIESNDLADQLFMSLFGEYLVSNVVFTHHIPQQDLYHTCKKYINYALMGKSGQSSEVLTRKNKSSIMNFRFHPIFKDEDVKGVTIIIEDLTQKHQQESLFRLLNSAVIYANDAIMITEASKSPSIKPSIVYVNKAMCELSGYTEEELLGNVPSLIQGKESESKKLRAMNRDLYEGKSVQTEIISYRKNGTTFWVNLSVVPLKDDNGRISHWISIQRDMSERHVAEATIRKQKNFLESIYSNTSEAILCTGEDQRPCFTNQAFKKLFQHHESDVTLEDLFADQESLSLFRKSIDERGKVTNAPFLFKRKDGTIFWGLSSFSKSERDGKTHYDGAIRDISDLKATEMILQEKNEALQKTNAELDRFVYSASHDLRAPLASSLGLINISRISKNEQEKHTYLDMMEASLNKMDKTIQDITDYQRNARLKIETEKIDFESMIDDIRQRLKYLKGIDEVQINTKVKGNMEFSSDKIRLYVILVNLISNAIKFMKFDIPFPYVNIEVHITQKEARILVEDNGIGIDSVHLDQVFGMFFQAARESTGSGLGLYIVRESINKLNGTVKVRSLVNQGTTFEVTLPNEL